VDEHGDARVNASYQHPADDLKLGNWVSAQRARYKAKTISDEEIRRLERLGFMWDPRAQDWEEHFQALIEFIGREGHGRVPPKHRTRSGLGLGSWICQQRQRNNGTSKSGDVEDEYRQKLDSVGMVWDPFAEAWEAAFKRLEEYVSAHGDSAVIATFKSDDGFGLGAWVRVQHRRYAKGRVDATRASRLEALPGWRWRIQDAWDKAYMSVQKYEFLTGHCMIPARYKDSTGMIIGAWVYRHRREYKNGTLSPERIRLLEAIPGWSWDSLRSIRGVT
jgi:hypothetical protein